jgi:hypothetical protein
MGAAFISWTTKTGASQSLYFDIVTDESQDQGSVVTENPVEEGAAIADHVRDQLNVCTLDVFVSSTPVFDVNNRGARLVSVPIPLRKYQPPLAPTPGAVFGAAGSALKGLLSGNTEYKAQVLSWDFEFDAVADMLRTLEALKSDRQLVDVVLPSRTYESMLLEKFKVSRNAKSGSGATFHLEFKELRTAEVRLVTPIPSEVRAKPAVKKGVQGPVPASAPDAKRKSVLKAGFDKFFGQKVINGGEL